MPALTVLQNCRTLQLTRGLNTLIDEDDFEKVGRHKWHAGKSLLTNYARRFNIINGRRVLCILHRVITNVAPDAYVDHKNGDGLDNRQSNLRACTHSENHRNRRRSKGRSPFKGVHCRAEGKWRAYCCVDGKDIWLGQFASEIEAARAYDAAAHKHYGEFARTNADIHGNYWDR